MQLYSDHHARTLPCVVAGFDSHSHSYRCCRFLSFVLSIGSKCVYWSKFVSMLNIQFHICDDLFDKYVAKTGFNCSFKACVREHCRYM